MNQEELNKYYLNNLLEKLALQKKTIFLLGDFNINLSEYENHNPTNEYLDSFYNIYCSLLELAAILKL